MFLENTARFWEKNSEIRDRIEVKAFFFRDRHDFWEKNSEIRDRIEVKAFFFRDRYDFWEKNSEIRDRIKVKAFCFFLENATILERNWLKFFFREHFDW